jgi:anaerobic magnesium-protoporphyrin IX monomethyl ester cyclase
MKVTLISVDYGMSAMGIRSISAFLRKNGHETRLILLPLSYTSNYANNVISQLIELSRDSGLIGISSMSCTAARAIQVIQSLKKLNIPIVWGGIHATICPEECIKHVDIVCRGEGEHALLELSDAIEKQKKIIDIKNFWIRTNDDVIRNDVRPFIENLDELPFADYDFDSEYVLSRDKIVKTTHELYGTLTISTSRGCPHRCTYCCNHFIQDLNKTGKQVRKRDMKKVVDEIQQIKRKMPTLTLVWFSDDNFFVRSITELADFSADYKSRINLPFQCYVGPTTCNEEKLKLLIDAGLKRVEMGIQSGSERISQKIYKRFIQNKTILKAGAILSKHSFEMEPPNYQFIISNPYETEEDILGSINIIRELPPPFFVQTFSLVLFPGTQLYEMAKNDKIINSTEEAYNTDFINLFEHLGRRKDNAYLNLLLYLMQGGVTPSRIGLMPRPALNILANRRIIKFFSNGPGTIFFQKFFLKAESKLLNLIIVSRDRSKILKMVLSFAVNRRDI